uniref:Odorant receptor n=1 Tax=Sirex noctilio TaxID=36765 RepID=A0A857N3J4_9HYME|nr:odorant receptor 2 [Sirex noctilio]
MSMFSQTGPIRDTDILYWSRRFLLLSGLWPESHNDFRLSIYLGYLIPFTSLIYISALKHMHDRDKLLRNMTEFIPTTMAVLRAVMFRRKMYLLVPIIKTVRENASEGYFKTPDERKVVHWYYMISNLFIKISVIMLYCVNVMLYLKPMIEYAFSKHRNTSFSYEMPYQISFIHEVTEMRTYILAYVYQSPIPVVFSIGIMAADSLLVTLVLYVCGQLSVLRIQIKNVSSDSRSHKSEMKSLIEKHEKLIRMAKSVENAFSSFLFVQMFCLTLCICVVAYQLLTMINSGDPTNAFTFTIFALSVVLVTFSYCFLGECLIYESTSLNEAYYDSKWYELPAKLARPIAICMARSQIPVHLTAGKFYVFSLDLFVNVIKASMGYLSVLIKVT